MSEEKTLEQRFEMEFVAHERERVAHAETKRRLALYQDQAATITALQQKLGEGPLLRTYVDEVNTFHHTSLVPLIDSVDQVLTMVSADSTYKPSEEFKQASIRAAYRSMKVRARTKHFTQSSLVKKP